MAKEAASRTLDYRLRADTLDRIKGAGQASLRKEDDLMPGDAITAAGATVGAVIQASADKKEKEKQEQDLAIESWEAGIKSFRARQSPYTAETFDQYRAVEEAQKAIYLTADKATQQKMLKEQQERSASLQALKTSIALLGEDGQEGFDMNALTKYNPELAAKLTAVLDQKGTTFLVDPESQEVYFQLANGDKVYANTINEAIEKNMNPVQAQRDFTAAIERQSQKGRIDGNVEYFSEREMRDTVNSMVTRDNVGALLYSETAWATDEGVSLYDHLIKGDDLWNVPLPIYKDPDMIAKYDTGGEDADGVLSPEELTALKPEDRELVIKSMLDPKNFELAKQIMVDYGIERGRKNHEDGTKRPTSARLETEYNNVNKG
tara:strand:+ start:12615 stop:13745 length:1131 start_codon:yes stop_codon:yes gene_type:complete